MLAGVEIRNFRSIESCDVELAPLTVLYGPTAAGKSSLPYALCVLRNFILNPNQPADGFFNLGFQNLGGFEACVFNHDPKRKIGIFAVSTDERGFLGGYGVSLSKTGADLRLALSRNLGLPSVALEASVSTPYPVNQSFAIDYHVSEGEDYTINWNGILATALPKQQSERTQRASQAIAILLNSTTEAVKRIDIAPHTRGFFKPSYTPVPTSTTPTTEDEVASLIINDPNMPALISLDTEIIFDRDFRTDIRPGTATVFFLTTDKKGRTPVLLVNDGFGVNQVVYILAKMHRLDIDTLLIEEPEVHLHPTVVRNLARAFCSAAKDRQKQFIFTTHSEQFLISLLTCVSEKLIDASMIKCYHVVKEGRSTKFEQQAVTDKGQIEGGLASFLEAETEDLKHFLSIAQ